MPVVCLHDKTEIEGFLRRETALHLYEIGDLDDFFWPYTTWYALKENDQIREIALLYTATSQPVLLALTAGDDGGLQRLVSGIRHLLPRHFEAHLSGTTARVLTEEYELACYGKHLKMGLTDHSRLTVPASMPIEMLTVNHLSEVEALYEASYPGNWFDPRMLASGFYYGIHDRGALISVGGVHVYSAAYRIAVLGNITTHPEWRGQGLARAICAKLCTDLLQTVDHIGLNVKAANRSAISCYEALGFETVADYEEFSLALRYAVPA